ncbi:hypothetical protein L345_12665 [Ophiophagus hannah]|uniref:Uncharacterized protein n=1 Tax=Ophiophagus hannah TaxID=8665 RepID=V8NHZ9_OPHHA|nr:hypothetical protein L345_12665 [Ophiophagus hannah]
MVLWQTRCVPATFCNPALLFSQDVRGFGGIWLSEKSEKVFQETAVPDDKGCPGSLLLCNNITMTTVPSAGCLLAKNHYYRSEYCALKSWVLFVFSVFA